MDDHPERTWDVYQNTVRGVTSNPLMKHPNALDEAFAQAANQVLEHTVQLAWRLIGARFTLSPVVFADEEST